MNKVKSIKIKNKVKELFLKANFYINPELIQGLEKEKYYKKPVFVFPKN